MFEMQTPLFVLSHEGDIHGVSSPANRELVRRIQACVAACEGISTEELEQGIVEEMRATLKSVVPLLQKRQAA